LPTSKPGPVCGIGTEPIYSRLPFEGSGIPGCRPKGVRRPYRASGGLVTKVFCRLLGDKDEFAPLKKGVHVEEFAHAHKRYFSVSGL